MPAIQVSQKKYAYTAADKEQWERLIALLPDTTKVKPGKHYSPNKFMTATTITRIGLNNLPLSGEVLCITGRSTHKNFLATAGSDGRVELLLPKGDSLDLHFKYDRSYEEMFFPQADAEQSSNFSYTYEGIRHIEKRKKEEAERLAAEKARQKKAEEEFKKYIKREGISALEGRKREMERALKQQGPPLVTTIFNRNKHWKEKLIVTDLTGSMTPYASELQLWYKLSYMKEQHLQFVFFNDGNNKSDDDKVIGSTGRIYYSPKGLDTLMHKMAFTAAMGSGGDVAENNMEALINGVNMAREPFKDIIMIADNNAPVKDISLLENFHHPVHVILCGVSSEVEVDYLRIAYKTGGTVHTMEEDIIQLAQLLDGQEVKINHRTYRLMKGRFVLMDKA